MKGGTAVAFRSHSVLMVHLIVAACLTPGTVYGQQPGSVQGIVVTGEAREPLSDVRVRILGADLETRTDSDGAFALDAVPPGTVTLRADRSGYSSVVETLSVTPGESSYLQIQVERFEVLLDELLVTGDRAPADTGQRENETQDGGARTVADLLSERVPGVQLRRNQGSAGGGANIQLRGPSSLSLSNSPAIYLDGVRLGRSTPSFDTGTSADLHVLEQLPAAMVERIRVLRGPAAAARYPDAANGVILIETVEGSPSPRR